MEEKKQTRTHKLVMENRQNGMLTGIVDVQAFDEETVLLVTECGKLQIKGEKLHVKSLDLENGELEFEGRIHSYSYLTKKSRNKGDSFLKHIFR